MMRFLHSMRALEIADGQSCFLIRADSLDARDVENLSSFLLLCLRPRRRGAHSENAEARSNARR